MQVGEMLDQEGENVTMLSFPSETSEPELSGTAQGKE
jgi:hypothetical protein